jgi:homoserine O-succinyltransferase/O-acetyltransferase
MIEELFMPICVPDALPAVNLLRDENVFIMSNSRANRQEIRPLKLLFLNLMPKKIETENQFLRLLSNSPLQIDIDLLRIDQRESKNTPSEHLDSFYVDFDDIQHLNYDGLIITGAPLGKIPFNEVIYWDKFKTILIWAQHHVTSTLLFCWAAQAALNIIYGLPKLIRQQKLSGVFDHYITDNKAILTRGFDDHFWAPHSRYADFPSDMICKQTNLTILAESKIAGAYLMTTDDRRMVFVTGHPEYDALTLANEYFRDLDAGLNPSIPENYFPHNDITKSAQIRWRSHAYLLFSNWLNYYVYQVTPYDLMTREITIDE